MIESGTRLTFWVMLLFVAVTWVKIHWAAGLAELVLVGLLYLITAGAPSAVPPRSANMWKIWPSLWMMHPSTPWSISRCPW